MRFIRTTNGQYVAVDTIAAINHVVDEDYYVERGGDIKALPGKAFQLITKRGDFHQAHTSRADFFRLLSGT